MTPKALLLVACVTTAALYYREYNAPQQPPDEEDLSSMTMSQGRFSPSLPAENNQQGASSETEFQFGYRWAKEKNISHIQHCEGKPPDFMRGCVEYVIRNNIIKK